MSDIFGVNSGIGGVFKGTQFTLAVTGVDGAGNSVSFQGALVQNLQISYQRQVTRFWELGSQLQYYVEGRVEGQGTMSRIVGPQGLVDQLVTILADICTVGSRGVTLTANTNTDCTAWTGNSTNTPAVLSLSLWGAVSTGITYGADAQSFVVNSSMNIMFASMQYNNNTR